VATSARKADGGYVLDGHKSVVFHAAAADRIVVSARTAGDRRDEGGITLFLVDGGADGLTRRNYPTVDGLRASDLTLAGVKVGADAVIGEVDDGLALLDQVIDRATAAVCAEALGTMGALHAVTGEYLKTRQQFGRAIGDFQVLQHRMVDMFIACEQSRSMTYMATLKLDGDAAERRKAVSAAKVQIGKAGRFVGQQAVQLHGGMGMTDELNVGHYFKRLTMIDTLFGNTDHHLDRFAGL
jgi:alkylation response protein AidB-like acyl-CoA dehydrogenase